MSWVSSFFEVYCYILINLVDQCHWSFGKKSFLKASCRTLLILCNSLYIHTNAYNQRNLSCGTVLRLHISYFFQNYSVRHSSLGSCVQIIIFSSKIFLISNLFSIMIVNTMQRNTTKIWECARRYFENYVWFCSVLHYQVNLPDHIWRKT